MMTQRLPLALACLIALPAWAPAATLTFEIEAVLVRQGGIEFATTTGDLCRAGDACYPADWVMPKWLGGAFESLVPGDTIAARFDIEEDLSAAGACSLGGEDVCGLFLDATADPATGRPDTVNWATGVGGMRFSFGDRTISYLADVGNFRPETCAAAGETADPALPAGFCDFFGYEAAFDIRSARVTSPDAAGTGMRTEVWIGPVPLPGALTLGLSGLAIGWGMRRWLR